MTAMNIENGDSTAYWEGARQGRLLLQRCKECNQVQFPPRHQCIKCWSADLVWFESGGRGTVESFTIVRRAPTAELREMIPYVVAAVSLAEGPRMITNIVGVGALEVSVDEDVQVTFMTDSAGRVLPQFRRIKQ